MPCPSDRADRGVEPRAQLASARRSGVTPTGFSFASFTTRSAIAGPSRVSRRLSGKGPFPQSTRECQGASAWAYRAAQACSPSADFLGLRRSRTTLVVIELQAFAALASPQHAFFVAGTHSSVAARGASIRKAARNTTAATKPFVMATCTCESVQPTTLCQGRLLPPNNLVRALDS